MIFSPNGFTNSGSLIADFHNLCLQNSFNKPLSNQDLIWLVIKKVKSRNSGYRINVTMRWSAPIYQTIWPPQLSSIYHLCIESSNYVSQLKMSITTLLFFPQIGTEPSDNQYLVVDIGLAAVPIIMIGNNHALRNHL